MIDEKARAAAIKAVGKARRMLTGGTLDFQPSDALLADAAVHAYESAKPKDAEGLKIGSRLTVDGVEAVVVPVEPPVEVFERLDRSGAVEREAPHYLTDEDMAVVWRHAIAMLSAAGDGR